MSIPSTLHIHGFYSHGYSQPGTENIAPQNSRTFQKATIHIASTLYFNYFHSIYTLLGNRRNLKII